MGIRHVSDLNGGSLVSDNSPRVSIGLPVFNAASTLPLALSSIFAQTFQDWELILLDDGSTDSSLSMLRAVDDPRIRVLADGENKGLTVRLNQLTRESRGNVIVRMDADDVMVPTRLERQLAVLDDDPDVDVVVSRCYLIDGTGEVYGVDPDEALGADRKMFLRARSTWFAHPTMTARKAWMLAHPYDESFRLGQERELFCRSYEASSFHKLAEPLLFYLEAGSVRIKSYQAQRQTDRRLLRMYGPQTVGWGRSRLLAAAAAAKEGIYRGAHTLGLLAHVDRWVARQRATPISDVARSAAQATLDVIARTAVPGLSSDHAVASSRDCDQRVRSTARSGTSDPDPD